MSMITLTTDFGEGSPYVAEMKGVLLTRAPQSRLVDITHTIPPQNVRQGALVLADVCRQFPRGTIHVAVVDPGVGTDRDVLILESDGHTYVGPDNGLFSWVGDRRRGMRAVRLNDARFWRSSPSRTFHGRDIMAPVAAHLACGVAPREMGVPVDDWQQLDWPEPQPLGGGWRGTVIAIDSFGNAVSNIMAAQIAGMGTVEVRCRDQRVRGITATYGDAEPGALIALFGSQDRLELACVQGNASRTWQFSPGDAVEVRPV